MKVVAFLMAVWVLVLSAMPCKDRGIIKDNKTQVSSSCTDPNKTLNDNCSPFCQCTSCPGFPVAHAALNTEAPSQHLLVPYTYYEQPQSKGVHLIVWQPPKLS